jgi:hypothetical protein
MFVIPLRNIHETKSYDFNLLEMVDTFSSEDQEWYDVHGWDQFRPEFHQKRLLPEIALPRHYNTRNSGEIVIPLGDKRYRLTIKEDAWSENWEAGDKEAVFVETDDPETKYFAGTKGTRRYRDYGVTQFFGQPRWIQGEYFPADSEGNPCKHLVTYNNIWGDAGNWNILAGKFVDGLPTELYFEASCC